MTYSERWWTEQHEALRLGREIEPPWIVEEESAPYSSEWQQGTSQAWMLEVWTPFWQGLSAEDRGTYLDRREADVLWRLYLLDPEKYSRMEWYEP